jgi:LemA protein
VIEEADMKKVLIAGGVFAVIVLILIISAISGYNRIVGYSQTTDAKWADVQAAYQRRSDLIPNLVQTVQGNANFEKSTLTQIADARASVGRVTISQSQAPTDAAQLEQFNKAQGQLGTALSRLLSVTENYPQLKASDAFKGLQTQLEGTENRINVARGDFNQAVQTYNTAIQSFPTALYAAMTGFHPKPYFQATDEAQSAPQVKFDFNSPAPSATPATQR